MNSANQQLVDCRITGGNKLPAETGGTDALCAEIRKAAAAVSLDSRFTVDVQVVGDSRLSAIVTRQDGTKLPEQKFSVSDRTLNRGSLVRFAEALAGEMARADNR